MTDKSNISMINGLRQEAQHHISHAINPDLYADKDQLLQKLMVHQVQLEMHNEALLRTQQTLENSLSRYVSLYEFAPVGYLTITENCTIVEANLVGADLLGGNRLALITQSFTRFIVPEDADRWHRNFYNVMQHGERKGCEVRMRRADGSLFYARLDCLLMEPAKWSSTHSGLVQHNLNIKESGQTSTENQLPADAIGLMVRVALIDITEKKLAEQELRVTATAFESQEGMMITDAKNVILKVNHAFTKITGYAAEEIVGKMPYLLSSSHHDAEFYIAMWAQVLSTEAWQGEVWGRRKNGEIYPQWFTITAVKDEGGAVTHYVTTFTDITTRKAAEDEMQLLAFYDPLTKLPNRRLMLDRLQRAMTTSARNRQHCALMFVDLDDFKLVNDTMGHDVGDQVLNIVAQRLAFCIRVGDTVSRVGGDEFMVMLENLSEKVQEAETLAENIGRKMLAAVRQPFHLAGREYVSSASIGVTLFIGHFFTVAEIQKQADLAMYEAKNAGRNTLRFFKPTL